MALASSIGTLPGLVRAASSRPLTLVAPFPAGSVTDNLARTVGQAMQQALGQPVVVDNRPGAQGTLAAAYVARSAPDGQTLLVASSGMFVARSFYRNLPYDPMDSFRLVAGIGSTSMMFMVSARSPLASVQDLTRAVERSDRPLTVGYGSPSGQLAYSLFTHTSRSNAIAVSYRGIPQTMTDLVAGHIDVAIVDIGSGVAQMAASGLRPIAISATARSPAAPSVPTLREAFSDAALAFETVIAFVAPAGTPPTIVTHLERATLAALAQAEVERQFTNLATSPLPLSAAALAERLREDNPRWEALIRQAGIEPE